MTGPPADQTRMSREVILRSHAAREGSRRLIATSTALVDRSRLLVDRTFSRAVGNADAGVIPWDQATAAFIRKASLWSGRDPMIEEAKTMLAEQLGISRGDAYSVLRALSQRERRAVRDLARTIVVATDD